jgi:hypothetical protein
MFCGAQRNGPPSKNVACPLATTTFRSSVSVTCTGFFPYIRISKTVTFNYNFMNQLPPIEVLIEDSFGTFGYNAELKCLFHFWKGFLTLEEVKRVAETTNPYMEKLGLTNVVADHRNMEMFSEDVSAYISDVWIPAQEKIGVKGTFIVMSPEAFTQIAAEEMHEQAREKSSIEIFHFDSMEETIKAVKAYNAKHLVAA